MKKKTFIIKLKSGLSCKQKEETEELLRQKIRKGQRWIVTYRGGPSEAITEENIESITEKK